MASSPDSRRTLEEWLEYALDRYETSDIALGQVASDAHDEALYLLLRTLDLPLDSDESILALVPTAAQARAIETALHRRLVQRIPAAYITREAWLGEHRFYVDERVIIPRSYFVEIIPTLHRYLPKNLKPQAIADVCTGSGCLAILLARQFPSARVDALDLSRDALDVAAINVRNHQLDTRVRLHASDVFDALPPFGKSQISNTASREILNFKSQIPNPQSEIPNPLADSAAPLGFDRLGSGISDAVGYDLILSNPPYEPSAHVDNQSPEFKAEPRLAHDGGPDGLVIIRKLLRQARERLAPHGIVVLEVGALRKAINREFAPLSPEWLPTEDGSNCICLIRAERLHAWTPSPARPA